MKPENTPLTPAAGERSLATASKERSPASKERSPERPFEERPREHYHLLVVDDEEAMRRSLADILRLEGYQVRTAPDGDRAIALLEKTGEQAANIDLILLDLKMPGTDGLDVLRFITEHRLSSSPDSVDAIRPVVILLTAHGSLESAIEALRQGASDYLLKPSSPAQILDSVKRGLERLEQASQKRQLIEDLEASVRKLKQSDAALEREAAAGTAEERLLGQRGHGSAVGEQPRPSSHVIVLTLGKGAQAADDTDKPKTASDDRKAVVITIDLARREIRYGSTLVKLTPTEGRLMKVFLENPQRVFLHRELVWLAQGYETRDWEAPEVLRPLVSRLRRKLALLPGGASWIISVRGTGYVFDASATTDQS